MWPTAALRVSQNVSQSSSKWTQKPSVCKLLSAWSTFAEQSSSSSALDAPMAANPTREQNPGKTARLARARACTTRATTPYLGTHVRAHPATVANTEKMTNKNNKNNQMKNNNQKKQPKYESVAAATATATVAAAAANSNNSSTGSSNKSNSGARRQRKQEQQQQNQKKTIATAAKTMNTCSRISKTMTGNSKNSKSVAISVAAAATKTTKNETGSNSSRNNSNSSDCQPRFFFLATAFFFGRERGSDRVFFLLDRVFFSPRPRIFFCAAANF